MSKEPKLVSVRLNDSDIYDDNKKGLKKEISVHEISNGFIMEERVYGYKDSKGDKWFSETTKTYYKENPLKDKNSPVSATRLADHF